MTIIPDPRISCAYIVKDSERAYPEQGKFIRERALASLGLEIGKKYPFEKVLTSFSGEERHELQLFVFSAEELRSLLSKVEGEECNRHFP